MKPTEQTLLEMLPKVSPPWLLQQHGWVYGSSGDVVQREGEWFELGDWRNSRLQFGDPGFCFYNARQVAVRRPHAFSYVEGYALIPHTNLPTLHAWVVDGRGIAWDVTWRWGTGKFGPPSEAALLGVRVPMPALRAHWRACGGASFLADYHHHYPALRVPFNQWETSLPAELERIRAEHCLAQVRADRARLLPDGSIFHAEHIGR